VIAVDPNAGPINGDYLAVGEEDAGRRQKRFSDGAKHSSTRIAFGRQFGRFLQKRFQPLHVTDRSNAAALRHGEWTR